jgi:radical SAM protein with 4Fe4S-binding SPASM domain
LENFGFNQLRFSGLKRFIAEGSFKDQVVCASFSARSLFMYGNRDMPLTVSIETTSRCTRKCRYCPIGDDDFKKSRPTKYMPDDVFNKIVFELTQLKTRGGVGFSDTVSFSNFGEPLTDNKLSERISVVRKKLPNSYITFFSNGDLLTPPIAAKLIRAGLNRMVLTPHDGKFNENIINIANTYPYIISINKPLTKFHNRGGKVAIPSEKLIDKTPRCVSPTYTITFTPDGTAAICNNDATLTYPVGNIMKSSLIEIWKEPSYVKVRKDLRNKNVNQYPTVCRSCKSLDK